MKILAKVGATSNSLWWAINGVSLLFAAANAAQRCTRTHIQTWFWWRKNPMKWVVSTQDYWVYLDITWQSFKIWEFWGEFWEIETFHQSKFSPATGVSDMICHCEVICRVSIENWLTDQLSYTRDWLRFGVIKLCTRRNIFLNDFSTFPTTLRRADLVNHTCSRGHFAHGHLCRDVPFKCWEIQIHAKIRLLLPAAHPQP